MTEPEEELVDYDEEEVRTKSGNRAVIRGSLCLFSTQRLSTLLRDLPFSCLQLHST
jgi:hypothetical protein